MNEQDYNDYLKTIIDSVKDPLLVIDPEMRVKFMNKAALQVAGIKEGDLKEGLCYDFLHGRDKPCDFHDELCPVQEVLKDKKLISDVRTLFNGSDSEGQYEISATPIFNEQGEIVAVVEVLRDVSDSVLAEKLKRAGRQLKQKHDELSRLFRLIETAKEEWETTMDCVQDMVILADDEGRIRRCNFPLSTFVRRPFEDILGRDWRKLLQESGLKETAVLDAKKGTEIVHDLSGKIFVQRIYPIMSENVSGVVVALHDITELKKITLELEKKNKEVEMAYGELKASQSQLLQQEKMASIGQLAAGVAHEINNPIGFVTSNLGTLNKYVQRLTEFIKAQSDVLATLKDMSATEDLQNQRKKLKIDYISGDIKSLINESLGGVERVKKIVQNLKNFSRVDQAEHIRTDINECMEDTLNIVWNELKYKTTVTKDYGDLPLTLCYPQQLNQVFTNLLVNAAQSIEKQGEITIKTWAADDNIYVSISDTGRGISKENLGHLFEPFFTTKDVGKGTGLGLSIVYDIVTKNHKGEISVDSEVGKGATFTVRIPVAKEE